MRPELPSTTKTKRRKYGLLIISEIQEDIPFTKKI
jgi:hypothetical protein